MSLPRLPNARAFHAAVLMPEAVLRSRERRGKEKETKEFEVPRSSTEIKKVSEAIEVFEKRGITNQQVASTLFELAQIAAKYHGIPVNHHLLRYGLRETLAALEDKKYQVKEVEDGPVIGELVSSRSLNAIWQILDGGHVLRRLSSRPPRLQDRCV